MPDRFVMALSLVVGVTSAMPAWAKMDHPAAACTAPGDLPPALQAWRAPVPATGGKDRRHAPTLAAGQAVTMALSPTPQIRYPVRPAKVGGPTSYGGLASFIAKQAGTFRIALGSAAWVDVVRNGKAATPIAHGRGPDCTGVRKMVDYQLTPGAYTLEVAANNESMITLLVTPLP